jgi:O-antigen/teichoic acid export membrane protein
MISKIKNRLSKLFKTDISKSIFSGYALFFINNIIALFLTPYMLQYVSKEEYGLYILCVDFLAWVSFLEFGTSKVIESKAGHMIAQEKKHDMNVMFNSSFYFQLLVGILVAPIFYTAVKFGIKETGVPNMELIIILFAISAGGTAFVKIFRSYIIASRKIYLDNSIQLFINILNYTLVLLLTPILGGLGLAIINVVVVTLILIRSNFRLKQLFPFIKNTRSLFDKKVLMSLFNDGVFFSLASIATVLITKIDSFVIGRNIGLEVVGYYYITIKLFVLVQKLIQILYNNYRPFISIFFGKGEYENIKFFYKTSSIVLVAVASFAISSAMLINKYFVTFWVGEEFLLNNNFIVLFGMFILLDLCTLPSRIVLVSSLYKIRNISIARVVEGFTRLGIVLVFFQKIELDILPLSSVIVTFLFGTLFFHFQIKQYFKNYKLELNNIITYASLLLVTVCLTMYTLNSSAYFPLVLLVLSILFLSYAIFFQFNNFKKIKQLVSN